MKALPLTIKGLIRASDGKIIQTDIETALSVTVFTPIGKNAYVEGTQNDLGDKVILTITEYDDIIVENSSGKTTHHLNAKQNRSEVLPRPQST